jgi:uncharacterized protein (TIGR00369 family)
MADKMTDDSKALQRSYTWQDPGPRWDTLGKTAGVDYLNEVLRGELPPPPVCVPMRFELRLVEVGHVAYAGRPGADFGNDLGSIQGGWLSALLDAALGSAVHSALLIGQRYSTVELKTNFVRPVTPDTGELICDARTLHVGRRLATAEGKISDGQGKLYAHGTTTCLVSDSD